MDKRLFILAVIFFIIGLVISTSGNGFARPTSPLDIPPPGFTDCGGLVYEFEDDDAGPAMLYWPYIEQAERFSFSCDTTSNVTLNEQHAEGTLTFDYIDTATLHEEETPSGRQALLLSTRPDQGVNVVSIAHIGTTTYTVECLWFWDVFGCRANLPMVVR